MNTKKLARRKKSAWKEFSLLFQKRKWNSNRNEQKKIFFIFSGNSKFGINCQLIFHSIPNASIFFISILFIPFRRIVRELQLQSIYQPVHAHITMFAINSHQLSRIYVIIKEMTFACYICAVYFMNINWRQLHYYLSFFLFLQ